MDQILRGIVASNYPENVKKSLILQFVSKATNSVAEEQSKAVFEIGAEWMTEERSRFLNETGKFVLITWAKRHKSDFQNYFTEDFLLSFLSKRKEICVSALDYIRTTFDLLQHTSQVFSMYTVVRHRIHIWVQQNTSIEFCAAVARLLIEFDHCWPVGENLLQFNLELIHALSKTELPKTSKQEMTLCIQNGAVIGALLNKMWMKNQALLFPVLAEVFKIISTVGPNPSVALASVVQYFPSDVIDTATKLVASNPSVSDGNLTLALGRMLNWLSWPGGKKVDQWIVGFLRALSVVGKNPILIAVTLEKVTQVFSRLFFPVVRESTMVVLSHMLLSFQHSPQAFHEIVELVPPLVESLKKENSVSSQFTLQSLAELMHCLMYQHTGFPELYGQLLDCLQDLPKPSEVMVKKWLTQSAWSAQSVKLPLIDLTPKSETGKIGLVNLGNTCYMNSVLQALYMLDEFRCMTFQQQTTSSQQPLLYHLQEVFAFLTLSQRSAFAPSKFLHVARPPWFAVGSQQDCSEFLKFLLDRTSEEDNSINSTNGKPKRPSLVDETFAGKLLVCHRCRRCNFTSCREEVFTDLPLAFPQAGELEGRSVASADNATSTKHAVENIDMTAGSNPTRTTERSLKGGDISQHVSSSDISVKSSDETNRDAAASAVSSHEPGSSGLSMSFSKGTSVPTKCHEPAVTSAAPVISINDLLEYFFEAEVLEGSNQYHCEACQSLQDAERSVVISKASNFLVLTLKRFAYNVRTQQRSKILQSVSYPVILRLPSTFVKGNAAVVSNYSGDWVDIGSHPTHDRDDNLLADSGFSPKRTKQEHDGITDVSSGIDKPLLDCFYGLCSVIVHSGTSSESGHYYCYAQSSGNLTSGKSGEEAATEEASSSQRNDSDTWHLFNDSRVSYSSFSSFAELSKRFPKDTPYVLIYKRLGSYRVTDSPYREEAAIQTEFTPVGEIRKELVDVVNHDNLLYLQEREKQAATMAKRRSNTYHPPDDDDDDENGKGPSGSCGSGPGFTTPFNRFVF